VCPSSGAAPVQLLCSCVETAVPLCNVCKELQPRNEARRTAQARTLWHATTLAVRIGSISDAQRVLHGTLCARMDVVSVYGPQHAQLGPTDLVRCGHQRSETAISRPGWSSPAGIRMNSSVGQLSAQEQSETDRRRSPVHTYIHTYIHTYMHTHIHTRTHTLYMPGLMPAPFCLCWRMPVLDPDGQTQRTACPAAAAQEIARQHGTAQRARDEPGQSWPESVGQGACAVESEKRAGQGVVLRYSPPSCVDSRPLQG
jgi:hypothetical protein